MSAKGDLYLTRVVNNLYDSVLNHPSHSLIRKKLILKKGNWKDAWDRKGLSDLIMYEEQNRKQTDDDAALTLNSKTSKKQMIHHLVKRSPHSTSYYIDDNCGNIIYDSDVIVEDDRVLLKQDLERKRQSIAQHIPASGCLNDQEELYKRWKSRVLAERIRRHFNSHSSGYSAVSDSTVFSTSAPSSSSSSFSSSSRVPKLGYYYAAANLNDMPGYRENLCKWREDKQHEIQLQKMKQDKEHECTASRTELQTRHNQALTSMRQQIETLQSSNQQVKAQLSKDIQDKERLLTNCTRQEQEQNRIMEEMKHKNKSLEQQMDIQLKEIQRLTSAHQNIQHTLDRSKSSTDENLQRCHILLESNKRELQDLRSKHKSEMTENQKNCDIRIDQKIDELNVSFSKQSEEIVSLSAQVSAENKKLEERLKQQEQKIEQLQQNNADLERKTRDQTLKHNQIIQATTNLHKTAMEDQKKAYEQEKMKLYNSNIRLGETIEESSATIAERDLEIVTIKSTINLYKQQLESKSAEINEIKEDTMKLEQKIRESATQTRILNEKMKRLVEDLSNKESECSEWKLKLNHKTQECEKLVLDQTQKFKKTLQQEKETILSSINHFLMALETRKRIRGVQSAWKKYYYP
jgi:hypothetical protein